MDFTDLQKMAFYKNYKFRSFSFQNQIYVFGEKEAGSLTNLPYLYYGSYSDELIRYLQIQHGYSHFNFYSSYKGKVSEYSKLYILHSFSCGYNFPYSVLRNHKSCLKKGYQYESSGPSQEALKSFYDLYKSYFLEKNRSFFSYEYFENIDSIFGDLLSFGKVFLHNELIGIVLLIRYQKMLIPLFGGYKTSFIKQGLKSFLNMSLIEYYKQDKNLDGVVFGSGVDPTGDNDSLFMFKQKFGDIYSLKESICL